MRHVMENPSIIGITMQNKAHNLLVQITDDGTGFDPLSVQQGYGIAHH